MEGIVLLVCIRREDWSIEPHESFVANLFFLALVKFPRIARAHSPPNKSESIYGFHENFHRIIFQHRLQSVVVVFKYFLESFNTFFFTELYFFCVLCTM